MQAFGKFWLQGFTFCYNTLSTHPGNVRVPTKTQVPHAIRRQRLRT